MRMQVAERDLFPTPNELADNPSTCGRAARGQRATDCRIGRPLDESVVKELRASVARNELDGSAEPFQKSAPWGACEMEPRS